MQNFFFNTKIWTVNNKRFMHCTGELFANHYETLKVKKDCSRKEIKEAFIKLSKQHHPDVNSTSKSHAQFQKIQEAYSVLSKPESRRLYDFDIGLQNGPGRSVRTVYYSADAKADPFVNRPWNDSSFYQNRDKSKEAFHESQPYYGIKGLQRQPNSVIAFLCVAFMGVAFLVQMVFIKYSFTLRRDNMMKRSMEAEQVLKEVRERANANGNKTQLEILRQNFELMQKARER